MSNFLFSNHARRSFVKFLSRLLGFSLLARYSSSASLAYASGAPPVWSTIPNQNWTVGVPITLDLNNYCSDPENDPLTFSLSASLPPGVTLSGGVISGTPSATFATSSFSATADDVGNAGATPRAPQNLRER